jgi:hypothetical protein
LTPTMVESLRWRRLRWRLRGAWQWPTFLALTAVDAVLIARLPFQGEGADLWGAAIAAGFFNLLAVVLLAPLGGMLVRRARPDLPRLIARDYAGAASLALVTAALIAGGLIHHAELEDDHADVAAVHAAVHDYVVASEPRFEPGLAAIDTLRLEPEHYRACVYGPEELPICFFVNTDQSPAGLRRDPAREPNEALRRWG